MTIKQVFELVRIGITTFFMVSALQFVLAGSATLGSTLTAATILVIVLGLVGNLYRTVLLARAVFPE